MLVEYGLWANETALCASVLLILGGLWNVICQSSRWGIGLYCLIGGIVFFIIEYPRSKRQHGRGGTPPRFCQEFIERFTERILKLQISYLLRFFSMLIFSFFGILNIETLCGAATMVYSSVLYFIAAIKHETWRPPSSSSQASNVEGMDNVAFDAPPLPQTEANTQI